MPQYRSSRRLLVSLAALAGTVPALLAQTAPAASTPSDTSEVVQLSPFTVNATRDIGYLATNSVSGTRLNAPIQEIPIHIRVVNEELIRDQGASDVLQDLVRYVPGVQPGSGNVGTFIRGFMTFANFRDGLPEPSESPSANVERIEILKGPASILYGVADPGGIINSVGKQPLFDADPRTNIMMGAGSWGRFRSELDHNFALGDKSSPVAYARFIGSYESYDRVRSLTDSPQEVWFFNPQVSFNLTPNITTHFSYERHDSDTPAIAGVPLEERVNNNNPNSISGVSAGRWIYDLPRSFNPEGRTTARHFDNDVMRGSTEARYGDNNVARVSFVTYNKDVSNTVRRIVPQAAENLGGGDYAFRFRLRQFDQFDDMWYLRLENTNNFTLGSTLHTVVAGADLGYELIQRRGYSEPGRFFANWNLSQGPAALPDINFSALTFDESVNARTRRRSYFVTDRITAVDDRVHLLVGARYDNIKRFTRNNLNGFIETAEDSVFSPQLGGTFDLTPVLSLFALYSESVTPNTVTSVDGNGVDPSYGEGFEAGLKASGLGGKINGTLSLFHIEKTNIANTDPANPFGFILSGRERSKGVEADLLLNLHERWQFLVAGSYTDAHVVSDVSPARQGARVNRFSPAQASFWTRYQLGGDSRKGWSVFGGAIYGSERKLLVTHDPNVLRFPSYLRFDAGISYTFQAAGARWTATVNVQNVNDEVYMEELLRWGNPRNYYARLSVSF